jgi:hypothetical protein
MRSNVKEHEDMKGQENEDKKRRKSKEEERDEE